jgi:hypothetical protein
VDGRFERVDDATWWGPGGVFEARAALRDLKTVPSGLSFYGK